MNDITRQLVSQLRTVRRDGTVRTLCAALAAVLGFALIVSLAEASGVQLPAAVVVVAEDVDLVPYELPTPASLAELTRRLWQGQVSVTEVKRLNPETADTTLPAGTVVTLPNHRDFPLEELAAP